MKASIWLVRVAAMACVACLLAFEAHRAHGFTIRTPSSLTVFDAKGKRVGKVLDMDFPTPLRAVVALEINRFLVLLLVDKDGFTSFLDRLRFESTDCTGPAYVDPPFPTNLLSISPAAVAMPGSTVYAPTGGAQTFTERSSRAVPNGGCEIPTPNERLGVLATPLIDLNTVFTGPFSVR